MYSQLFAHIGWHRYSTGCAVALALAYLTLLLLANGLLTIELNVNVSANAPAETVSRRWLDTALVTRNLLSSLTQTQATWAFWPLQLLLLAFAALLCITRHVTALLLSGAVTLAVLVLYQGFGEPSLLRFGLFSVAVLFLTSSVVQLVGALRERHQLADAFEQFVPPEVARQVADDPGTLENAESVRELTVLFCDVRGFTGIAEQLTPSQLTGLLNRYFDVVTRVDVIVSEATVEQDRATAFRELGTLRLKGRERALRVYQPIGRRDQLSNAMREELSQHEQAMALLRTRQWLAARPLITQLAETSAETELYNGYLAQITDALRPDPDSLHGS